ncbi:MAG TPA: hypothetical protein VI413_13925 [Paludibacter sp.]
MRGGENCKRREKSALATGNVERGGTGVCVLVRTVMPSRVQSTSDGGM